MAIDKKIIQLDPKSSLNGTEALNSFFPFTLNGQDWRISGTNLNQAFNLISQNKFISSNIEIIVSGTPRTARINNLEGGDIDYSINGVNSSVTGGSTVNIPDTTKNYTLVLTASDTFEAIEEDDFFYTNNLNVFIVGLIPRAAGSIWNDNGFRVALNTSRQINMTKGINFIFGGEYASSTNLIIPLNTGNSYKITGSTKIETLNTEEITGLQNFIEGSQIILILESGGQIAHLATTPDPTVEAKPFSLRLENDFTATKQEYILFILHEDRWNEVGATTVLGSIELSSYTSVKKQAFAELVNDTTFIYGFEGASDLDDVTVENEGTAGIQVVDDRIEFTTSGTAYNVKVIDQGGAPGTDKYFIPLSEGSDEIDIRQEIIEGQKLRIANSQGITTQNDYFANHEYGCDELERTSDNEIYHIPFKTDKTSNYVE